MIPKIIHYCWFGNGKLGFLNQECIDSWSKYAADYEFKRWDESNIDLDNVFVQYCIQNKRWAFLSDYIRMKVLKDYGGIYLDVDVELVKPLDDLLRYQCFMAYEDEGRPTTGVVGGVVGHEFFRLAEEFVYARHVAGKTYMITPEVAKICLAECSSEVEVLSYESFYPYNPYAKCHERRQLMYSYVSDSTYGIHHWGKSWKMSIPERLLRFITFKVLRRV